jgi:hypothetical protein
MSDLIYIALSITAIIAIFYIIYLKGKNLQQIYEVISGAIREKQKFAELRSLSTAKICTVFIKGIGGFSITINDAKTIACLSKFLADAQISKTDQSRLHQVFILGIVSQQKEYTYSAYINCDDPDDLMLQLIKGYNKYVIRVPGLNRWIEKNVETYKKISQPIYGK